MPDAEMLVAIGEVLDTPVSTLPGETVPTFEPGAYRRSPKNLRC